jgi:hypothetical protein
MCPDCRAPTLLTRALRPAVNTSAAPTTKLAFVLPPIVRTYGASPAFLAMRHVPAMFAYLAAPAVLAHFSFPPMLALSPASRSSVVAWPLRRSAHVSKSARAFRFVRGPTGSPATSSRQRPVGNGASVFEQRYATRLVPLVLV